MSTGYEARYSNAPYLDAARAGLSGCGKVNDKASLNAGVVLTDAGFLTVIPDGYRIVVPCVYIHLSTPSDEVAVEFGYTENANGSGTFTPMTPKLQIETGAANVASSPQQTRLIVPLIVDSDTGGALTARVTTNDAGATVTVAFNYILEKSF